MILVNLVQVFFKYDPRDCTGRSKKLVLQQLTRRINLTVE
jgi:hypothetical protein